MRAVPGPIDQLTNAVRLGQLATVDRPVTGVAHDDADGDVGSFATDDARGFDPLPLLTALSRHGARVVVMGQVAGILHGSTELTGDLDLLWDGSDTQAPLLAAAFASCGASITDADGTALALDAHAFSLPKVFFRSPTASGDCCTPKLPWGGLDIDGIIERADVATGPNGVVVSFVNADDLIAMRRAVGRVKDLRRNAELEALR